jgi:hypothetical protein
VKGRTLTGAELEAQRAARRRGVGPTSTRRYDPASHCPPQSMNDNAGGPWLGTSRVIDRPARRKAQRRSWRRLKAEARRDFLSHGAE